MSKVAIKALEKIRGSKVIVYFNSAKPPFFQTQVASDVLLPFRRILESFPKSNKKITLLIDTDGGNLDTPWPLVNLIREYCEEFEVIVADDALSAGTLIALGADKIVMLPHSHLSPIDPAALVPDKDKKQNKKLEIEDIAGYLEFAKTRVGITEQAGLIEILKDLSGEIHPTMLGSAHRTHALIRSLAKRLIELHKNKVGDKNLEEIVNNLSSNLYSHAHRINRKEAKNYVGLGDVIEFADELTLKATEEVTNHFWNLMEVEKEFEPEKEIKDDNVINREVVRAVIHSTDIKYNFIGNYVLARMPSQIPGQFEFNINNNKNSWKQI